jgi:hypothetical protein
MAIPDKRCNMTAAYPDDADGDALRQVASGGSDMSVPMVIDFAVDAPDEASARALAAAVEPLGFDPSIYENPDDGSWTVSCSKSMLATYEGVVAAQAQLQGVAIHHGATCDGWGSFGNSR